MLTKSDILPVGYDHPFLSRERSLADMDVSVIICTWNNASGLSATLRCFQQCRVPSDIRWELIVVNNNCTDETDLIVERFFHVLPIVSVREPLQGLSQARNAGLAVASGELVIFTDDDVKPVTNWIGAYWQSFREKPTACYFGGPVQSEYESQAPDPELISLAPPSVRGLDFGATARALSPHEAFIGPNWACPVKALRQAGGFDPAKGLNPAKPRVRVGEETDLMQRLRRLGYEGWYVPEARIIHVVPAAKCTLTHIAERAEAHGEYAAAQDLASKNSSMPNKGGAPLWMYRLLVETWLKWVRGKAFGRKSYDEYIAWREIMGRIRAFRATSDPSYGSK